MELIVHQGDLEGVFGVIGVIHLRDRGSVNVPTEVYVLLVESQRADDREVDAADREAIKGLLADRLLERALKTSDFDTRRQFYIDLHVEPAVIERNNRESAHFLSLLRGANS
jgi:hypothetical protein